MKLFINKHEEICWERMEMFKAYMNTKDSLIIHLSAIILKFHALTKYVTKTEKIFNYLELIF